VATDFAVFLRRFLTSYLAGLRGCSPNTIASYRDTFKLLISWFRDERQVPPGRLTLDRIDAAAVTGFLNWLETGRHNSISTRNQRLACSPSPTGPPARAGATRPCSPRSTTPGPGSRNSPTWPSATSASSTRPWHR